MPVSSTSEALSELRDDVRARWHALDPLLPAAAPLPAGCGTELVVTGPGGAIRAAGSCVHWAGSADSLAVTWGAARQYQLTALVAGPDVRQALDELLSRWREHLAELPDATASDCAAVVTWPSRDVAAVLPLVRHGLAPLAVVAARDARTRLAQAHELEPPQGLQVRHAGPADIDAVVALGMEVIRFDANFGSVTERTSSEPALRLEMASLLAEPQPWVWLAERDGEPVGMLAAERPQRARWIAPMAGPAPVAYLQEMAVRADQRSRGTGAAMAAALHRDAAAAGVPLILLHYAQVNPLSAPFWSQQGYRPLWTIWEASPPGAVR
jgi:GNAT superfamily N-acetyltransferase